MLEASSHQDYYVSSPWMFQKLCLELPPCIPDPTTFTSSSRESIYQAPRHSKFSAPINLSPSLPGYASPKGRHSLVPQDPEIVDIEARHLFNILTRQQLMLQQVSLVFLPPLLSFLYAAPVGEKGRERNICSNPSLTQSPKAKPTIQSPYPESIAGNANYLPSQSHVV